MFYTGYCSAHHLNGFIAQALSLSQVQVFLIPGIRSLLVQYNAATQANAGTATHDIVHQTSADKANHQYLLQPVSFFHP